MFILPSHQHWLKSAPGGINAPGISGLLLVRAECLWGQRKRNLKKGMKSWQVEVRQVHTKRVKARGYSRTQMAVSAAVLGNPSGWALHTMVSFTYSNLHAWVAPHPTPTEQESYGEWEKSTGRCMFNTTPYNPQIH